MGFHLEIISVRPLFVSITFLFSTHFIPMLETQWEKEQITISTVCHYVSSASIMSQLAGVLVIIQLLFPIKPLGWWETDSIWFECTLMSANIPHGYYS